MKIISAAIRFKDKIYTGASHDEIIINIIKERHEMNYIEYNEMKKEFITDSRLFVSRKRATNIAYKAGQIKTKKDILISSDIL